MDDCGNLPMLKRRVNSGKRKIWHLRRAVYSGNLMNAVIELEEAYNRFKDDPQFRKELDYLMINYAGRPSPLYFAKK